MAELSARLVEIACDESGAEGEHLVGGETTVFSHASVQLTSEDAHAILAEVYERVDGPITAEFKASRLMRNGPIVDWLLSPAGPIHGRARVYLLDKAYFLLVLLADVLMGESTYFADLPRWPSPAALRLARELQDSGPRELGASRWAEFGDAANLLLRARWRRDNGDPNEPLFALLDSDRPNGVLGALRGARDRAETYRTWRDAQGVLATIDPLIPALARTILHWTNDGAEVAILHDETSALTPGRMALLSSRLRLVELRRVDSGTDSRIQVADFLAGIARRIAEEVLRGDGSPQRAELLRPYVDPSSLWSDPRSWAVLAG
jgi:hypothetical protein